MKTSDIKTMSEKNVFGRALQGLFDVTKNKLSRKEWSVLLGVSDAAISQWMKGKTFPEADKISAIISIIRDYELNESELDKLKRFMSVLELPADELWSKVPSRIKGQKASDYVLSYFKEDLSNSMSSLYYDLKLELYNQLSKNIHTHKKFLISKFLREAKHQGTGLFRQAILEKSLDNLLCKQELSDLLTKYAGKVKSYHSFCNVLWEKLLLETGDDDEDLGSDFDLLLRYYDEIKANKTKTVPVSENKRFAMSLEHVFPSAIIPANEKVERVPELGFEPFDFRRKSGSTFEISFKSPGESEKTLLNMEVSKFLHGNLANPERKEKFIYWTFNYEQDTGEPDCIRNSWIYTEKDFDDLNKVVLGKELPNYGFMFDIKPLDNIAGAKYGSKLPSYLRRVINEHSSGNAIHTPHGIKYLIEPKLTNSFYSVEILNVENNGKIPISNFENGWIFLLLGKIDIVPKRKRNVSIRGMKKSLTSLFDNSEVYFQEDELPKGVTASLDDDLDYEIKSHGCDSIALFVSSKLSFLK